MERVAFFMRKIEWGNIFCREESEWNGNVYLRTGKIWFIIKGKEICERSEIKWNVNWHLTK